MFPDLWRYPFTATARVFCGMSADLRKGIYRGYGSKGFSEYGICYERCFIRSDPKGLRGKKSWVAYCGLYVEPHSLYHFNGGKLGHALAVSLSRERLEITGEPVLFGICDRRACFDGDFT